MMLELRAQCQLSLGGPSCVKVDIRRGMYGGAKGNLTFEEVEKT